MKKTTLPYWTVKKLQTFKIYHQSFSCSALGMDFWGWRMAAGTSAVWPDSWCSPSVQLSEQGCYHFCLGVQCWPPHTASDQWLPPDLWVPLDVAESENNITSLNTVLKTSLLEWSENHYDNLIIAFWKWYHFFNYNFLKMISLL